MVTMIVAALVEARRLNIAREHGLLDQPKTTVPMSVWWLVPQYVISGVSDVFTIVGLQELFYDQMPEEMRSIGAAAYLSVLGVGSFLSSAVISIVQVISTRCGDAWLGDNLNRAHLDYYYWVLAGLNALGLCVYVGIEVAERFAFYGMSENLITYLTNVLHQSTATAAKNVNIWTGVSTLLPLLGGFVVDTYLGQFKTILFGSLVYVVGISMLVISVSVIPLRYRYVTFFFNLYIVAVGEGGHKPCVQTFGTNQFDKDNSEDEKAKSSLFNWCYFGICGGAAAAIFIVIYIQDNVGYWAVAFGIPVVAMVLALVLFLLGRRLYRRQVPSGNPLTRVAQVFAAACRKRCLTVSLYGHGECCEEGRVGDGKGVPRGRTLTHSNLFTFLDKETFIDDLDASSTSINNWRLCSVKQLEEGKLLIRLIPVWLSCLMYAIVFAQIDTFFTKQGNTVVTTIGSHFRIPPALLQVFIGIVIVIFVPIYNRILVPVARNITGLPSGITTLQRIGIGIFFSTVTMIVAALVEARRLSVAREHGLLDQPKTIVPMSGLWLLPQYIVIGVSDVFTIVGLQELFYDQMPEEMRSMGAAVYLSVIGVGSLLSSAVISIVQLISTSCGDEWLGDNLNRAHLDYYYWVLAGLNTLALCVYVGVAKCFVYKKIEDVSST
ncbi:hypothetical protein HHK36_011736 [Tetracentron sinense]|uniref:Uncharacterized protein n=1 Tax=Tetracentron sinense TaxID=13715 RepID=A0A834ZBL0_TETSI|nr:hypothetical protein HHK36_011736 [Tetracentron sinense]